jgi:signal transduction histidine kinase
MGLGLAISKKIIENSNGRIWFTSEKDKGSSFFVALPVKG